MVKKSAKELNNEQAILYTLKSYLDSKGEKEMLQWVNNSSLTIEYTSQFTYSKWNQYSAYIDLKVPVIYKEKVEQHKKELFKYLDDIFVDTDEYALMGVNVGILIEENQIEIEENGEVTTSSNYVYDNLITKIHKKNIDPVESSYIYEACMCGKYGYKLAAATMLGCAAEQLLLQLCKAYLAFLCNGNGTEKEQLNFEKEVLNAKKAHARLDGFKKVVANKEKLFEELGLENSNLHFTFLDLIRQVRNESGHPTGVEISSEDLKTVFGNYQLLIERVHPLILSLPNYKG